jgi:hypothetical protein
MTLKPGTLCILVKSGYKENLGKVCEIVSYIGPHTFLNTTYMTEGSPTDAYRVMFQEPVKGVTSKGIVWDVRMIVARSCLLPISDPGIDTTETEGVTNEHHHDNHDHADR